MTGLSRVKLRRNAARARQAVEWTGSDLALDLRMFNGRVRVP